MSKKDFRKLEFSLNIFSIMCIILFIILAGKLKESAFLCILLIGLLFTVFQSIKVYLKEIQNISKTLITKEEIINIFNYAIKKNKFDTFVKIFEALCFIYLAFIYENGFLLVPFVFALLLTAIQINIKKYDKEII